jgi:hypothetical protein
VKLRGKRAIESNFILISPANNSSWSGQVDQVEGECWKNFQRKKREIKQQEKWTDWGDCEEKTLSFGFKIFSAGSRSLQISAKTTKKVLNFHF